MVLKRSGLIVLSLVLALVGAFVLASRWGYVDRGVRRFYGRSDPSTRLSAGDFPAGVSAPVGDVASVPLRPTLIGFTPHGGSAALLLAASSTAGTKREGLFKTAYALDAKAVVFANEGELRKALSAGGENGGVDLAAVTVDRLAEWGGSLWDAAPRTLLLLSRSRGQEALAAVGASSITELKGKRLGVCRQCSTSFFALWLLSRAGLGWGDVTWVDLPSAQQAGSALREGRADAVVGFAAELEPAAKDRGGKILATSSDAPHLLATVLVARGDFAARYPDAIRRVIRGLLDAGASVARESSEGAKCLGEVAPYLGDPADAIRGAPPASMKDNLAFFGLAGEAPVTYDELYASAAALAVKLGRSKAAMRAEDTRDLGPLKYVHETRAP